MTTDELERLLYNTREEVLAILDKMSAGELPSKEPSLLKLTGDAKLLRQWNMFYADTKLQYTLIANYLKTAFSDYRSRTALQLIAEEGFDWSHPVPGVKHYYHPVVLTQLDKPLQDINRGLKLWLADE